MHDRLWKFRRIGETRRGRFGVAIGMAVVYAACYSAIKVGLASAPPLRFGGLRATLAGVTLLLLLLVTRRPVVPARRLIPGVLVLALAGTIVPFAAMFSSPGRTGAGIASLLGNTTPLFALALARPLLGEHMTGPRLGALGLGLLGASLIASTGMQDGGSTWYLLLPVVASLGFAVSSIWAKKMQIADAVLEVVAWQFVLGGLALLAWSGLSEPLTVRWNLEFSALLGFLAIIGTALTTAVWYWLLQRDEVARLSLALFITPVVGLALGGILFGERLGLAELAGATTILAALGVAAFETPRSHEKGSQSVQPPR